MLFRGLRRHGDIVFTIVLAPNLNLENSIIFTIEALYLPHLARWRRKPQNGVLVELGEPRAWFTLHV